MICNVNKYSSVQAIDVSGSQIVYDLIRAMNGEDCLISRWVCLNTRAVFCMHEDFYKE